MYNNGISCSFSSLLHTPSTCGSSVTDPLDVQCVTLEKCNEDVYSHLKFLKVGPDTICDEKTLLLARAGTVLVIGFFNNHFTFTFLKLFASIEYCFRNIESQ